MSDDNHSKSSLGSFSGPQTIPNLSAQDWNEKWNEKWNSGDIAFDQGQISPALEEFLSSNSELLFPKDENNLEKISNRTALVPGCGKGYDVVYLSQKLGLKSYGIDISKTAIKEAKNHNKLEKGQFYFISVDFFDFSKIDNNQQEENLNDVISLPTSFDLIYDYTFLCSFPPNFRLNWAKRITELIKSGGILITLQFPIFSNNEKNWSGGPPFGLTLKDYDDLLEKNFEKIYQAKPKYSHPGRNPFEWIAIWRKY